MSEGKDEGGREGKLEGNGQFLMLIPKSVIQFSRNQDIDPGVKNLISTRHQLPNLFVTGREAVI